jgi:hypothetical protein
MGFDAAWDRKIGWENETKITEQVNHMGLNSPLVTKSWRKIIDFCNAHYAG